MTFLNRKLILAAVTFAAAANVSAIDLLGGDTPDVTITISGATASDKSLRTLVSTLCSGSVQQFTDRCGDDVGDSDPTTCADSGPKLPGKSYSAYFCEMDTASAGISSTKKVLIRKRSTGGSFWGTVPVATAQSDVQQMVLDNSNCKATATPGVVKCDKNVTEDTTSDAGISDEEPGLFTGPNIGSTGVGMTKTLEQLLDADSIAALTFGVPVTNNLYVALQKAQGLNADLDGDGAEEAQNESASVADIRDNMPSLSTSQIAALFKGSIGSWDSVFVKDPTDGAQKKLKDVIGVSAPSNDIVAVCRRVNGSGTQAQLNALFLNSPCSASAADPAADNTQCTTDKGEEAPGSGGLCAGDVPGLPYTETFLVPSLAPMIHANSGSGDVTECLDQLNDGNFWAVGVQSTEKTSSKWAFVKIDGVEPTLEQVANGRYRDWAATSFQWRKGEPTGDKLVILQKLRTDLGKPEILDALNIDQPFGRTNWLANGTAATSRPFDPAKPVMQYERLGGTCDPQTAVGSTDFSL